MEKKELRLRMRQLRDSMKEETRLAYARRITSTLLEWDGFHAFSWVYAYLSVGSEVETRPLIEQLWQRGKQVAVPRVAPDRSEMHFYPLTSWEQLERGTWGIEEPRTTVTETVSPGQGGGRVLLLVPALACDRQGYRLGYGGGFYDRYLQRWEGLVYSVGLAYSQQCLDTLPKEEHDRPLDAVLTERGWYKGGGEQL